MKFRFFLTATLALLPHISARAAEEAGTNAPAKPEPTFEVRGYRVEGNTVLPPANPPGHFSRPGDAPLPPKEFDVLTNYVGQISFARVREAVGALQLIYRNLGFATVSVTLPQQKLTNGILTLKVVEGRLISIDVQGNRYYSSNNIRRALPSLTTNVLINTKWFQPELDRANASVDRQIYPVVGPGPDPGTTALALKVKDRLPLHGHFEINDKAPPGTPLLRMDSAIQYNNLWQLEHQAGLQYCFSPQEMKTDDYSPNILEQPMISSYSGYYRIPFNTGRGLREEYDRLPVNFGYDEVTHRFTLPPATGNPELLFFASRSASDTKPTLGPISPITNGPAFDTNSQFASRTLTFNNDVGLKYTLPLRDFHGVRSALSFGLDYKTYEAKSYNTNLTYFDLYSLDAYGNRTLVTNTTTAASFNSREELHYLPLSLGWTAARADKTGVTSFYWNQNVFLASLASARTNFQAVAQSAEAGGTYTTVNLGLTRDQRLPHDWSVQLRANGQWASAPVINNEQFGLGGTAGVRGYREGEAYADTGWRALFDLRAPPVNIGYFPVANGEIPAEVRCSWFMDYGRLYMLDRPDLSGHSLTEWGTGFGVFLTVGEHIDARLSVGWALMGASVGPGATANRVAVTSLAGEAQAYFSLGVQF